MSNLLGINPKSRQYAYEAGAGGGVSSVGFDHAQKMMEAVFAWMKVDCPKLQVGTAEHYAAYRMALDWGRRHSLTTGKQCDAMLDPRLAGLEGQRVEVTSRDGTTRRFYVGKSTGWLPVYLEVARRDSKGGPSIYLREDDTVRRVPTGRDPKRK